MKTFNNRVLPFFLCSFFFLAVPLPEGVAAEQSTCNAQKLVDLLEEQGRVESISEVLRDQKIRQWLLDPFLMSLVFDLQQNDKQFDQPDTFSIQKFLTPSNAGLLNELLQADKNGNLLAALKDIVTGVSNLRPETHRPNTQLSSTEEKNKTQKSKSADFEKRVEEDQKHYARLLSLLESPGVGFGCGNAASANPRNPSIPETLGTLATSATTVLSTAGTSSRPQDTSRSNEKGIDPSLLIKHRCTLVQNKVLLKKLIENKTLPTLFADRPSLIPPTGEGENSFFNRWKTSMQSLLSDEAQTSRELLSHWIPKNTELTNSLPSLHHLFVQSEASGISLETLVSDQNLRIMRSGLSKLTQNPELFYLTRELQSSGDFNKLKLIFEKEGQAEKVVQFLKKYQVKAPDGKVRNITSVGDLVNLIRGAKESDLKQLISMADGPKFKRALAAIAKKLTFGWLGSVEGKLEKSLSTGLKRSKSFSSLSKSAFESELKADAFSGPEMKDLSALLALPGVEQGFKFIAQGCDLLDEGAAVTSEEYYPVKKNGEYDIKIKKVEMTEESRSAE